MNTERKEYHDQIMKDYLARSRQASSASISSKGGSVNSMPSLGSVHSSRVNSLNSEEPLNHSVL